MILDFSVKGQLLSAKERYHIAANALNFVTCRFDIDGSWFDPSPDMVVKAVFTRDGTTYHVLLDSGLCCTLPHEVLKERGSFSVSLIGIGTDGEENTVRATANCVRIEVVPSGELEGINSADPTPSELEQLEAKFAELGTRLTGVMSLSGIAGLCSAGGVEYPFIWLASDTEFGGLGGTMLRSGGIYTVCREGDEYSIEQVTTIRG